MLQIKRQTFLWLLAFVVGSFAWTPSSVQASWCAKAKTLASQAKTYEQRAKSAVHTFRSTRSRAASYVNAARNYNRRAKAAKAQMDRAYQNYLRLKRSARTAAQKRNVIVAYSAYLRLKASYLSLSQKAATYRNLAKKWVAAAKRAAAQAKSYIALAKRYLKAYINAAKACQKEQSKPKESCSYIKQKYRSCKKILGLIKKCKWKYKKVKICRKVSALRTKSSGSYSWASTSLSTQSSFESVISREMGGNWFEIDM